jgi:hypothetical protein
MPQTRSRVVVMLAVLAAVLGLSAGVSAVAGGPVSRLHAGADPAPPPHPV